MNFNIYPYMLSWVGAFFICRGIIMIWLNNEIAEMKQFLFFEGFIADEVGNTQSQFEVLLPMVIAVVQTVIFFVATCFKGRL